MTYSDAHEDVVFLRPGRTPVSFSDAVLDWMWFGPGNTSPMESQPDGQTAECKYLFVTNSKFALCFPVVLGKRLQLLDRIALLH